MSAALEVATEITVPGVYDLPAAVYHADPVPGGSLSSSGARRLLPPSCPALYRHWATQGQEPKAAFDFGHAAHALVLGVGAPIVSIDAEDWRTTKTKTERTAAYATGSIPLLRADYEQVQHMAAALLQHPVAAALFHPTAGKAEQSLFWVDSETGVQRRAMLDWLPNDDGTRLIIPDYKSCRSAEPTHLSKAMQEYGYIQQAAWYLDGVEALRLSSSTDDPAFVFVFQEKTPPYLVTVVQPDPEALQWGRVLNRKALDIYRHCGATGYWPGYADDVISVALPKWAEYQHQAAYDRGDYNPTEPPA